jgi:hypothetical protein
MIIEKGTNTYQNNDEYLIKYISRNHCKNEIISVVSIPSIYGTPSAIINIRCTEIHLVKKNLEIFQITGNLWITRIWRQYFLEMSADIKI